MLEEEKRSSLSNEHHDGISANLVLEYESARNELLESQVVRARVTSSSPDVRILE